MQNILGHIEEPKTCPSCQRKWMMKMVHNRSIYLNKQIVKMQVPILAHRMHVLHSKQTKSNLIHEILKSSPSAENVDQ